MNGTDVNRRLRQHGDAWRTANCDRPAVDWDVVTASRWPRGRLVIAGVAATAAAVVIAVVVIVAGHATKGSDGTRKFISPPAPTAGAPVQMYGIVARGIKEVAQGRTRISAHTATPVISLGVSPDGTTVYTTSAAGPCRTRVQATFFTPPPTDGNGTRDDGISKTVATVPFGQVFSAGGLHTGAIAPTPVAVSPGGQELAFETNRVRDPVSGRCVRGERLVVVTPETSRVEVWSAPTQDAIRNLEWSPDGGQLAYDTAMACALLSYSTSVCGAGDGGTRVLDLWLSGRRLNTSAVLLPAFGARGGYGPVFWWHDHLAATFNGSLHLLNGHGGLGAVVATGFPQVVNTISSTGGGDHLLISSEGKTYRWDNGILSVVPGAWDQPGW
jgi:dipeptidyl aminopeptidase/acylaminoacyl peptidase